jgi:hypothetical protein
MIGEINVGFSYAILWNVEEVNTTKERHDVFAKKLLNYLVMAELQDIKPLPQPNRFKKRLPIE